MIEATCSACGTLNRISEADVPVGAKFVTCTSCKSRVPVPPQKAAIPSIPKPGGIPSIPKVPAVPPVVPAVVPPVGPSVKPPPTPVGPPGLSLGNIGTPPTGTPTANPGSDIGIADLPAPRRQSPLGVEPSRPAPRSALSAAMDDLPAPKPVGGGPLPSLDLDDLMGVDLPAPKANTGADLPAPKAAPRPVPAAAVPPAARQPQGVSDLPAPKPRPPAAAPPARAAAAAPPARAAAAPPARNPPPPSTSPIDLPAPKGGLADLPAPKPGGGGLSNLPTPKAPTAARPPAGPPAPLDLELTPRAELPMPKQGVDLPAPKGFFDDLPQPARDGGSSRPEVPAPKGFFDDLPQPARSQPGSDVAPKGFFEDLPQRAIARPEKPEVPAPKGFFDDLPQPAGVQPSRTSANEIGMGAMPLELDEADAPIELAEQTGFGPAPTAPPQGSNSFDDLDLSRPSVGASAVPQDPDEDNRPAIRFGGKSAAQQAPGQQQPPDRAPLPSLQRPGQAPDVSLELEGGARGTGQPQLAPKRSKDNKVDVAALKEARARRSKIVLGVLLGLAAAGGGGFYLYQRHAKAQARTEEIDSKLAAAKKALVADDAGHWTRAATAASQVIELDDANVEAIGIAAESSIAGALADGKNQQARFAKAQKLINDALGKGVTGPALERAQALVSLTTAPDKAIGKLTAQMQKAPKDGALALYLGWAQAAAGDPTAAAKSFDQAIALTPSLKVLALDGRARAKLELADIDGARSDFNEILKIDKDNIPAQVGLASTLPQSQEQQQEADLNAIIARKDFKDADPRAIAQAFVLTGYDALRGRRLDVARERFRKAQAADPKSLAALTGLAETELRDRKVDVAYDTIAKALQVSQNDVRAQLVAAEIEISLGKLDVASERIQRLGTRKPPLTPMEQAQLQLITGRLLEAQNKDEAAIDAYSAAAKLAGDFDLTPTMAAVEKLGDMSKKASDAGNPAKANEYKQRADQLLSALDGKAQTDPQLAMTLGIAYLQANNPEKAEGYLRRVVEARATDADALYQYGRAEGLLAKFPDAIESLKKARDLAPGRSEIGLELAITYERTKDDASAGKLYDELTARDDASNELRARAGKYFVRTSQIPKAGVQGTKILASDSDNAAGHYLKGEGLFVQQRYDDARKECTEAVRIERDAVYLDCQGRTTEAAAVDHGGDTAMQDQALRAYLAATELDPLMFDPLLGAGRIYVARREHQKASQVLTAASQVRAQDADVAYLLGVSYQELGQKKDLAIKWLSFALDRKQIGEAAYRLGELYRDEDINKPAEAQAAYARAVRIGREDEKAGVKVTWPLTDAMYMLGRTANDRGEYATAKAAWEQYLVRPDASRFQAHYDEARRALATSLKSVAPPAPEK